MATIETENHPYNQRKKLQFRVTKVVGLTVEMSQTVEKLKAAICEKEGPDYYVQELSLDGKLLLDHETPHGLGIERNATLDVILGDFRRFFVRIPAEDRTVVVEARADDPLHRVRLMIMTQGGFESDKFSLIYDGTLLEEDDRSLLSLGIMNNSILHVVLTQPHLLSVFVQPPEGQILKLQVRDMFTIGDIKAIAGGMLGFSIQCLGHAGKQLLNDSRSLASYNIKDGSVLHVVSMTFQVFVRTCSGKSIVVDVHSQTTIAELKVMNYQRLKIPCEVQSLEYGGRILENDRVLMSYNIGKHCTISIMSLRPKVVSRSGKLGGLRSG